jgi:hypothetical protein
MSGSLIKVFVNENMDFFEEDVVMTEWLNVLEMAVKFENEEETERVSTRGPHRKSIAPRSNSESPDKSKSRPALTFEPEEPIKNTGEKIKQISKHIHGKLERRKRKYKKKQIEYIGWYYEEPKDARIRDLIDVIALPNSKEDTDEFFEYIFRTAYMQPQSGEFGFDEFNVIQEQVKPILIGSGFPILVNHAVKALVCCEFYKKLSTPKVNLRFTPLRDLVQNNNKFDLKPILFTKSSKYDLFLTPGREITPLLQSCLLADQ